MQLVIPHETAQRAKAGLVNAVATGSRAVVEVSGAVVRSVQVRGRVLVDVSQEAVDVKEIKGSLGPTRLEPGVDGSAIAEDGVEGGAVLLDLLAPLRDVVLRLAGPELAGSREATVLKGGIERRQVQRRQVQQDETTATGLVDGVENSPDALGEVSKGLAGVLVLGQEGIATEIVGSDPKGVDGVVGGPVGEDGPVRSIGDEGRDLVIQDSWEVLVDGAEVPRDDLVGAGCAADGVVDKLGPDLTAGILVPGQTTAGGHVALAVKLAGRGRVAAVAHIVSQTAVVRIAVAKGHKKVKGLLGGLSSSSSRGSQGGAGQEHGEQHGEEKRLGRTLKLLASWIWKN